LGADGKKSLQKKETGGPGGRGKSEVRNRTAAVRKQKKKLANSKTQTKRRGGKKNYVIRWGTGRERFWTGNKHDSGKNYEERARNPTTTESTEKLG